MLLLPLHIRPPVGVVVIVNALILDMSSRAGSFVGAVAVAGFPLVTCGWMEPENKIATIFRKRGLFFPV